MKISFPAAILSLVLLAGCTMAYGPSSGNTAEEMFQYLIENPVPAAVTNLQGVGDTWQGYQIWLRFNATPAYIASLTKQFTAVDCSYVGPDLELPEGYDRFTPTWNPTFDRCYVGEVPNTWGNGHHEIAVDTKTGTVYFVGGAP